MRDLPLRSSIPQAVNNSAQTWPATMTQIDIATRVYNHAWKLDPIVRSLLDTDFYKLLMLQMIHGLYPTVRAKFALLNRSRHVRIADAIDDGLSQLRV